MLTAGWIVHRLNYDTLVYKRSAFGVRRVRRFIWLTIHTQTNITSTYL